MHIKSISLIIVLLLAPVLTVWSQPYIAYDSSTSEKVIVGIANSNIVPTRVLHITDSHITFAGHEDEEFSEDIEENADEEFETENNIFASIKIRNNKISPSGSTKQVIDAYEYALRHHP